MKVWKKVESQVKWHNKTQPQKEDVTEEIHKHYKDLSNRNIASKIAKILEVRLLKTVNI